MSLFISDAMAASGNAAAQPQGGLSAFLLPLAFVAILFHVVASAK